MATVSTLANGIKVATLNNGLKAARVGIFSGQGSGAENVAHVEKTNLYTNCLKVAGVDASTSRSHSQISAQALNASSALGKITGAMGASVGANLSAARAMAEAQASALDNNHWDLSKEYAYRTAFQGEALGEAVTGDSSTIQNATEQEVASKASTLLRSGCAVVAVGDVDHEGFCAEVEKALGHLTSGFSDGTHTSQLFTGSLYRHRFDSMGYCVATLMQHAVPMDHEDYLNLRVANETIGAYDAAEAYGDHSPVNLKRRFTRIPHACSKMESFYDCFSGNGTFGVTMRVEGDGEAGQESMRRLQNFWAGRARKTTEFEVVRAKNSLLLKEAMAAEQDPVAYLGMKVLRTGSAAGIQASSVALGSVTVKSVQGAMSKWMYDQEIAAGMVGNVEGMLAGYSLRALTAHQIPDFKVLGYNN